MLSPADVDSALNSYEGAVKLGVVNNDNLAVQLG